MRCWLATGGRSRRGGPATATIKPPGRSPAPPAWSTIRRELPGSVPALDAPGSVRSLRFVARPSDSLKKDFHLSRPRSLISHWGQWCFRAGMPTPCPWSSGHRRSVAAALARRGNLRVNFSQLRTREVEHVEQRRRVGRRGLVQTPMRLNEKRGDASAGIRGNGGLPSDCGETSVRNRRVSRGLAPTSGQQSYSAPTTGTLSTCRRKCSVGFARVGARKGRGSQG